MQSVSLTLIHWIVIYPVDSAIQVLNNWGLVDTWKKAVDSRNIVGVLSTDMSKAFDVLCPPLLISILKAYGFSNNSLDLMRLYFSNRKNNKVRISPETTSDWYTTMRGCPQGWPLEPSCGLLCTPMTINCFQLLSQSVKWKIP